MNFVDMYFCSGLYLVLLLVGIGVEVVGVVEVVGFGVMNVVVGDCVIYMGFLNMLGVYSIEWLIFVVLFVWLLVGIVCEMVVVMMMCGFMLVYLLCCIYVFVLGDMILLYVVVGGVGLIVL